MAKKVTRKKKTAVKKAPTRKKVVRKKATSTPAAAPTRKTTRRKKKADAGRAALTHDQIAARAHDIWVRKGRPIGMDHINWHEAEEELIREASA